MSLTAAPEFFRRMRENRKLRRFVRHRSALVGLIVLLLFVAVAIAAPLLAGYDPIKPDFLAIRKPPSMRHLFGTDDLGRDILSRIIWGGRTSLLAGVIPVALALSISLPLGLLAGYAGGWIDGLIMRMTDAMLASPFLVTAIALAAFLGPSLRNAMIAIGIAAAPTFLRLVRGAAIAIKTEDYIMASRAVGCSRLRIAIRHILPNMAPQLLIQASLMMASSIIAEASMSFLGLGQQPPTPSWGSMLTTAQRFIANSPWIALWPGLMIFVVVMAFNLVGDGLRDAMEPRRR